MMKKGFSSTALSILAAVCMVEDHFAAAFLSQTAFYIPLRSIGRMTFPIFLFLLTQGVKHTASKPRYLARLAVFAVISELPFDLLFYRKHFYPYHQNTLFTLAVCAFALMLLEKYKASPAKAMLGFSFCAIAANIFYADGGALAVFLAVFMCGSAYSRAAALFVFSAVNNILSGSNPVNGIYIWNMAALIPISLYNGERGGENWPFLLRKWGFYLFYPLHLTALLLISQWLK